MSAEGIERGEHRGKGGAHFAQSLDGLGLSAHTTAVGTYLLLGRFKMKTFFLYEISNHAQVLDIGGCIEHVPLSLRRGLIMVKRVSQKRRVEGGSPIISATSRIL